MKPMFNPSLMCMDLIDIKNQIEILNDKASFYHVDIMDGHYVQNITLSPDFVKAISKFCKIPIDCHLMVTNPQDYIKSLAMAGAEYISVHSDVISGKAFRIIEEIHLAGCKAGVVLNPENPVSDIELYLPKLEKVTIMSVDPGFSGQKFIPEVLEKIKKLKRIKHKRNLSFLIEIDGSCNENTFKELYEAGAEVYIVGNSGLFSKDADLEKAWDKMLINFERETGVSAK